jgi:D-alanine-D-alanine ligase
VELTDIPWTTFEACFLALHGGAGEDGRIQAELETLGVPYTGSRPYASRRAMSKSATKERLFQANLPTLNYALVCRDDAPADWHAAAASLGYPLVAKPDSQGSSLGVSIVRGPAALTAAITQAGALDPFILLEPHITGRELTISVLEGRALPVLEIASHHEVFDYEAKYSAGGARHTFPNDCRFVAEVAAQAYAALGLAGLARVDVMLEADALPWILEANTIPGLTEHSLAPKAARRAGLDMPALCEAMLAAALKRAEPVRVAA